MYSLRHTAGSSDGIRPYTLRYFAFVCLCVCVFVLPPRRRRLRTTNSDCPACIGRNLRPRPFSLFCGSPASFVTDTHLIGACKNFPLLFLLERLTRQTATALRSSFLFSLCIPWAQGLSLGSLIDLVLRVDPSILVTALLATTTVFVCFAGAALFSKRRSYLYLGGLLSSGLMGEQTFVLLVLLSPPPPLVFFDIG